MSRLEEIKKHFLFWIEEDESIGILPEDIEWLIQQAERVEELENEYKVKRTELLEEHIDRLQNRVDELERLEKSFDELDSDYIDTKKENEALAETRRLDAVENVRLWEENQRYKQALDTIRWYIPATNPQAMLMKDIAKRGLEGDNS